MNRKWLTGVVIVACLAGSALWAYRERQASSSASGSLTVTPAVVEVQRGESDTAHASVVLKNSGSRAIHIGKVETSCHCTSVDAIERMDLAPGQSTTLQLKLQLPSFGKQEASVTIHTDSSISPRIRIPVKMQGAEIHPPYFLTQASGVRHAMTTGEDRRVEFEVSAVESPGTPWMTGMDTSNAGFSVVSCESSITTQYDDKALHRTYHCVLDVSQYIPGETLRGTLRPRCRSESMKPLPLIPVTISSSATAKAIPSQLFISRKARQSPPLHKTVVIETATNTASPVREVTASVDWVQVERIPSDERHPAYRVTITPPANPPADLEASVLFQFNVASLPAITVPLIFE